MEERNPTRVPLTTTTKKQMPRRRKANALSLSVERHSSFARIVLASTHN